MRRYYLSSDGHSRSVINNSLKNVNDHRFIGEYYRCTYYCINEDPYIYGIHNNERK